MSKVKLYDIASNDGNICWSPYSWKVRLCLNFKGAEYETVFLEYPDVSRTLKSLGVPPGDPAQGHGAAYTIPTIELSDGLAVMESMSIANMLELLPEFQTTAGGQTAPSLHLRDPTLPRVEAAVLQFDQTLYPNFMAKILDVLNADSREYFHQTRTKAFGGTDMATLERTRGGEQPWQAAAPALQEIASILGDTTGPFVRGNEASYADFVIVGFWQFLRRVNKPGFDRLMQFDASFPRLYEACLPWIEKKQD